MIDNREIITGIEEKLFHKVNWHSIEEGYPKYASYGPIWIMTDAGIKLHRYDPNINEPNVQGFLRGGDYFEVVTHWAWLSMPELPE